MFRSIVEAVSQRFARAKKPDSAACRSVSGCPQVNEDKTPEIASIPEGGEGAVESDVFDTKPDEIRTPEKNHPAARQ